MSNVVLGAGVRPALDADKGRRSRGAHDLADVCGCNRGQFLIGQQCRRRIGRSAEECAKERGVRRCPILPLRRHPGARRDTKIALLTRDDEAAASERAWDTRARSQPRATLAVDTYGTAAQSAARSASALSSRAAAACAGEATITACAVTRSSPIVMRHSLASRTQSRTGASRRRALAGSRASIADTSSPIPPRNALKTPSPAEGTGRWCDEKRAGLGSGPQSWRDRGHGQMLDIPRVDSAKERLRDCRHGLRTELPTVEVSYGLIVWPRSGRRPFHHPHEVRASFTREEREFFDSRTRQRNAKDRWRR